MSFFHAVGRFFGIPCCTKDVDGQRLFLTEKKPERKPLRLLILVGVLLVVLALSGCGASKYESVDLSIPGSSVSGGQAETGVNAFVNAEGSTAELIDGDKPSIVLGGTGADAENGMDDERAGTSENAEDIVYHDCDDYVIVTADTLNVRESDNTTSKIYIQLATGEVLHRIGYNEKWCRIEYDGGVAYVAADMVELTERPVEETASKMEESSEAELGSRSDVEEETTVPFNGHVVAIDAGHQAKANAEKELIGPASQTKKAKMPEGAVGTVSGVKEYELTLTVAKQLVAELKARGYKVVMIRESHDVNLSEAERSKIANNSDAEIFIRLHANSMENSSIYGAMAMCMTEYNPYNSELSADSYRLSKQIINNICANTGTKNRGVQKVDNSSSINWCEIPVSVVEMGFLTNPDEDRWLQEEDYQGKIVSGISDAVDTYFSVEVGE